MADNDFLTILSFDAGSMSESTMDPFDAQPHELLLQIGTDGGTSVQIEECDGFTKVSSSHPDVADFTLPGIFQPSSDADDVCIHTGGAELCFKDIDPSNGSHLPLIEHEFSPFESVFPQSEDDGPSIMTILGGEPTSATPDSLTRSYADYYFLKEAVEDVRSGKRYLSPEEDAYLRMHATAVVGEMKVGTVDPLSSEVFDLEYPMPVASYGDPITAGFPILTETDHSFAFEPLAENEIFNYAYANFDESVPYKDLSEITTDQALDIELVNAKQRVMEELKKLDAGSYYNHAAEIDALASIDDPHELSSAIDEMLKKIERGQKLMELRDVAFEVGQYAIVGDEELDLLADIRDLAEIDDEVKFAEGIGGILEKVKIVSLANGLDALVEMSDELIAKADDIIVGTPKDEDAYSHCSHIIHGRSGCSMGVNFLAGTRNSADYKRYFENLKKTAIAIRERLASGDYEKASTEYLSLTKQDKLQDVISRLEGDLEMTQSFKFTAKIGIIIAAAAIANVAGAYVAGSLAIAGAPAWVVGAGEMAVMSGVFLTADKGLNSLLLGEDFFDPNLTPGGNAISFMEQWAMTALMFKFLRLGMNAYNVAVKRVLFRRAGMALLEEGVITEAQLMKMGAKTLEKVAARAELNLMGKILNYGGLFGAEYITFTAWDFLAQTYEASKEAKGLALPHDFFTGESFAERFKFLACLKIGGALASPFTTPLQAKTVASLTKKLLPAIKSQNANYRKLIDELVEYQTSGTKNPAKLDAIHGKMLKLLEQRHVLEKEMSKHDPSIAKSAAHTKAVLDNVKAMNEQALLFEILDSGSYAYVGKARALKLLRAGKKEGVLTYRAKKSGDIIVELENGLEYRLTKKKPSECGRGPTGWPVSYGMAKAILPVEVRAMMGVPRQKNLKGGQVVQYASGVFQFVPEKGGSFAKLPRPGEKHSDYIMDPKAPASNQHCHVILEGVRPKDLVKAKSFSKRYGVDMEIYDHLSGKIYSIERESGHVVESELPFQGSFTSKKRYKLSVSGETATLAINAPAKRWKSMEMYADLSASINLVNLSDAKTLRINMKTAPDKAVLDMLEKSPVPVEMIFMTPDGHHHLWRSKSFDPAVHGTNGARGAEPLKAYTEAPVGAEVAPVELRFGKISEAKKDEINDFLSEKLAGKKAQELTAEEQRMLVEHLGKKGWQKEELQDLLGVEGMMQHEGYGKDLPYGFESVEQFHALRKEVLVALDNSDHVSMDKIFIHGSSATGIKHKTGTEFNWEAKSAKGKEGERSDMDIGVEVSYEGFAHLLVEGVLSTMRRRGANVDFNTALQATIKWLDHVELDPKRATDLSQVKNIKERRETVKDLEPVLKTMYLESDAPLVDTRCPDGLEWWQHYGNGTAGETATSKGLQLALSDKRLPFFSAGPNASDAYWHVVTSALEVGYDRKIQISYMLGDRPLFPKPDAMMVLGGAMYASPQLALAP